MTVSWHSLSPKAVLEALQSDDQGLTESEGVRRLARDGPNVFRVASPISAWTVLLAQLRSVVVLVLNVAIGFTTELRAHRAMEALLGLEALALAVEPGDPGIMRKPPADPHSAILPASSVWSAVGYAVLIALPTLAAFAWGLHRHDGAVAGTLGFMTLAFAQIFHLGNARSDAPVLSPRRMLGNRYALAAAALAVGLQLFATLFPPLSRALHVTPLSAYDWLIVGALGLTSAVVGQSIKVLRAARHLPLGAGPSPS